MQRIGSEEDEVTVRLSHDELRLLGATLNEALNGAYAIPDAGWDEMIGPSDEAARLLDDLIGILDQLPRG